MADIEILEPAKSMRIFARDSGSTVFYSAGYADFGNNITHSNAIPPGRYLVTTNPFQAPASMQATTMVISAGVNDAAAKIRQCGLVRVA
jgi:hypothetical protein